MGACGIAVQGLPLLRIHQPEQGAGLGIIIVVILAEIPVPGRARPAPAAVPGTPAVPATPRNCSAHSPACFPHCRPHASCRPGGNCGTAGGGVHRNLVMVHPQPVPLGVPVGEQAPWSILSGEKPMPGTTLAGLNAACSIWAEIVVRVPVEFQHAHLHEGVIPRAAIPWSGQTD